GARPRDVAERHLAPAPITAENEGRHREPTEANASIINESTEEEARSRRGTKPTTGGEGDGGGGEAARGGRREHRAGETRDNDGGATQTRTHLCTAGAHPDAEPLDHPPGAGIADLLPPPALLGAPGFCAVTGGAPPAPEPDRTVSRHGSRRSRRKRRPGRPPRELSRYTCSASFREEIRRRLPALDRDEAYWRLVEHLLFDAERVRGRPLLLPHET